MLHYTAWDDLPGVRSAVIDLFRRNPNVSPIRVTFVWCDLDSRYAD